MGMMSLREWYIYSYQDGDEYGEHERDDGEEEGGGRRDYPTTFRAVTPTPLLFDPCLCLLALARVCLQYGM